MTEKSVIFRDNQATQADDFNNMQNWITKSIDDVVADAIGTVNAYTGLTLAKTGATQCTISPGRLYWGGVVYAVDTPTVIDLFNVLPVTQQKQVAIVAYGQVIQQSIQPRNFIIDAATGQSQPQSVAMESDRVLQLAPVIGVESPSPTYPTTAVTTLLIGYILLNPTGIVSYQQSTGNQLVSAAAMEAQIQNLGASLATALGDIVTLTTGLANLAKKLSNYVTLDMWTALMASLADMDDDIHKMKAASYTWYGTDQFLDETQSNTAATVDGPYKALIHEGLRFGTGAKTTVKGLSLLNPHDDDAWIGADGFIFPDPSGAVARISIFPNDLSPTASYYGYYGYGQPYGNPQFNYVDQPIQSYTYATLVVRNLYRSRMRFCCGLQYIPNHDAVNWWYESDRDPTTHILSFDDEEWEEKEWKEVRDHDEDDWDWPRHGFERNTYMWRDYVDLEYWSKKWSSGTISGNYFVETFVQGQDGWLTSIAFVLLGLTQPTGTLTLVVCDCDRGGRPDIDDSFVTVVVDNQALGEAMEKAPWTGDFNPGTPGYLLTNQGWWGYEWTGAWPARVPIPPVFLKGGRRYGLVFVSSAPLRFAFTDTAAGLSNFQGEFWSSTSNGLVRGPSAGPWTGTKWATPVIKLFYATWFRWQSNQIAKYPQGAIPIHFQPLQLAGGIAGVEVLAEHIVPRITTLKYQVQMGGNWMDFDTAPNSPLWSTNPALLPFRVLFIGTTDLMPGFNIVEMQIKLSGPLLGAFHHISNDIIPGNPIGHVELITLNTGFDAAHCTLVASIHYNTTVKQYADVITDQIMGDGSLMRTWIFNVKGLVLSGPTMSGGAAGVAATTSITFVNQPANNDSITFNGSKVTFKTSGATGLQVNIGASLAATVTALQTFLNSTADAQISQVTWGITGGGLTLTGTADVTGTAMNAFTIDAACVIAAFTPILDGSWDGTATPFIVKKLIKYAS